MKHRLLIRREGSHHTGYTGIEVLGTEVQIEAADPREDELTEAERLAEGDEPFALFLEEETARICIAILPGVEREPPYHLAADGDAGGLMPGGFPVVGTFGEQGPRVRGWFRRYHPEVVRDVGTVELLNRSPAALAAVLDAAGGGALERIGRELAARRR